MRLIISASLLLITACAHNTQPPPLTPVTSSVLSLSLIERGKPQDDRRRVVVTQARAFTQGAPLTVNNTAFEPDPVGFVRAAYWAAGVDLFDSDVYADTEATGMDVLWRTLAKHNGLHDAQPKQGDLVFFDTPSGEAKAPAQVGIVEAIGADGTLTILGVFANGPARIHMNLRHGTNKNDTLGNAQSRARAADLFKSFADPFGDSAT